MMHFLKRKRKGKIGTAALKVDISKAYDHMEWAYLQQLLERFGFSIAFVDLIMMCVKSVNYHVMFGGDLLGPINPQRGLRQGDPLSPYLFILCAKGLTHTINKAEGRGSIHGGKIARHAPTVSHLFFVDDSYYFFRATETEAKVVQEILQAYEIASGQAINF